MIYESLKIAHILSAALLVSCMIYCIHLWRIQRLRCLQVIDPLTWSVIAPFALIQLLTGFTLFSLKQEALTQFWVKGSVLFFMIALISWFSFVYLLKLINTKRGLEWIALSACAISILSMIFLMANKV